MTVWIVLIDYPYEGSEVDSVHATEASALRRKEALDAVKYKYGPNYNLEEHEVAE